LDTAVTHLDPVPIMVFKVSMYSQWSGGTRIEPCGFGFRWDKSADQICVELLLQN
jgi:hypothetical protein